MSRAFFRPLTRASLLPSTAAAVRTPFVLPLPIIRKLATASTPDYPTISEAIKNDHRELETYYQNIMEAKDKDTQERWQNQFIWELAR